MSLILRKRILKTLERFKFKAHNPDSHIYGYFQPVKHYNSQGNDIYELDRFKFVVSDHQISFYYDHHVQATLKSFWRTTYFSKPERIHELLNDSDLLTNNITSNSIN